MLTRLNTFFLMTACAATLSAWAGAHAQDAGQSGVWPKNTAVRTETGHQIPAGAFGIARIETPRVATLLQLRGITGRGTLTLKNQDAPGCLTLSTRFVAGDFGGQGIGTHTAEPVHLLLQSSRVARALADSVEVVSNMYRISSQRDDHEADIIILSGLSDSHGFVLHPGRSVFADIFGAATRHTDCSERE